MNDPSELANIFDSLDELKGAVGIIATVIFLSIRLYRLPQWQESLPLGARWENLHITVRYGIIAALSGIGAGLAAVAQGLSWQQALSTGIVAALTAIITNKVTKTGAVQALAQVVVPQEPMILQATPAGLPPPAPVPPVAP